MRCIVKMTMSNNDEGNINSFFFVQSVEETGKIILLEKMGACVMSYGILKKKP